MAPFTLETEVLPVQPPPTQPNHSPAQSNQDGNFPRELRYIFVQLLFSLTAAETARQFALLVGTGYRPAEGSVAYAHLLLAGMVIVTSWVGWAKSEASRRLRVEAVFSAPFFVLLTDVALVFLYFLLVRSAEIPSTAQSCEARPPVQPSASEETLVVACIFSGYFLWDVLTKGFIRQANAPGKMEFPTKSGHRVNGYPACSNSCGET